MGAYEELLYEAVQGNSGRFARQDYVEEAWRIVDPILDDATPVYEYEPGTWGPPQAGALIAPNGEWFAFTARPSDDSAGPAMPPMGGGMGGGMGF